MFLQVVGKCVLSKQLYTLRKYAIEQTHILLNIHSAYDQQLILIKRLMVTVLM